MITLETVFSPALLPFYAIEGKTVVIIDILRATTSICYALHNGANRIVPVETPEQCLAFRRVGMLCAAERNGEQLPDFDMGNSPYGFEKSVVEGRDIAITTTNGTYALHRSKEAENIYIGSFLNIAALIKKLKSQKNDVLLVCAGWKNKANLEDTLFAGAVAHLINDYEGDCDSTLIARDLFEKHSHDLFSLVKEASHAQRFSRLGIENDLEFCLQFNLSETVPYYKRDELLGVLVNDNERINNEGMGE